MIGKKIKCIFIDENMDYLNGSETIKIIRKLQNMNKINSYNIVSITALEDNESKIKMSGRQFNCPHCNYLGSGNTMFRWHFDNCKTK